MCFRRFESGTKGGEKHAKKLTKRFGKTDPYYDAQEKAAARAKTPTSPAKLQIQSGQPIQIR